MSKKKLLITGATGQLGRAIVKEFSKYSTDWDVLGCGFTRSSSETIKLDLTDKSAVSDIISNFMPNAIIHCAAERRPDICENDSLKTHSLNVLATENLCHMAENIGAFLIYISTDYVFDGENAPYQPTNITNPLNAYGLSKLNGEKVTLASLNNNMVLRVPVLYGEVETLSESAVTCLFKNIKNTSTDCQMSHIEQKFPTNTADIAIVLRILCEKRLINKTVSGIFHWSGNEKFTKYEMAIIMANVFKIDSSHIKANTVVDVGAAKRPINCQLDVSKTIEIIGVNPQTKFQNGILESLKIFA